MNKYKLMHFAFRFSVMKEISLMFLNYQDYDILIKIKLL